MNEKMWARTSGQKSLKVTGMESDGGV
jgi:hypothetical protein